jgi:hypothetical protein
VLFCREKAGCPTGLLPLAFSDMPRNCSGTDSSSDDAMDALRDAIEGDCGVACGVASSASESSSSPIAKALFSSGTLVSVGVRGVMGLRKLSIESARWGSAEFSLRS